MQITKNIFSDIPFFFSKNSFTNDLSLKKDGNAIRQSIINIVLTRLGEKPFKFDFGTVFYDLLFENINNEDVRLTPYKIDLQAAVNRFEPRIQVMEVDFNLDTNNPRILLIDLTYQNVNTRAIQTVTISVERNR